MTTIAEFITGRLRAAKLARRARLVELAAPASLIKAIDVSVAGDAGLSKVAKLADFGHLEFTQVTPAEYRRGTGFTFTTPLGPVYLIPGPYGLFLTKTQKSPSFE